jgi:hypothetical protein
MAIKKAIRRTRTTRRLLGSIRADPVSRPDRNAELSGQRSEWEFALGILVQPLKRRQPFSGPVS